MTPYLDVDLSCNKWYKSERHFVFSIIFFSLFFFWTTLETKLNNGRPRWSILSCSRNFRVIPEALFRFYYVNWFSPITLLLSIWCFVSNAAVIVALLRSEIKSIRPGLLMLCSLSFTDLFRSVIVALTFLFIRLRHLLNSQVCQVYSEIETTPWASCTLITYIGTILNLTIIHGGRGAIH